MIPDVNNDPEHINSLQLYLKNEFPAIRQIDLLPYHNIADHKYEKFKLLNRMKDVKKKAGMSMEEIKNSFEREGFIVKVGG